MEITTKGKPADKIKVLHDGRMDVTNAAAYMGLSRWYMYNLMEEDNAPKCYKILKKRYFYKEDLDAWLKANTEVVDVSWARKSRKENLNKE